MLPSSSKYRHGNMVFFDVLGLFVVAYPSRVGSIVNYAVVLAVVSYLGQRLLRPRHKTGSYAKDFFCGLAITLVSWFTSLVTVLIIAVFVSLVGRSLSWYNHFYVSVCLYGTAAAAKIILIHTLAKRFHYVINFIYLARSTTRTMLLLTLVCAATLLLVCSGAFFPYSSQPASPRPKRVFLQHMTRTFHDLDGNVVQRDSGIWINGFDYTGMAHVTPHVPEINDSIRAHCEEKAPLCGFPWYLPVHFLIRKNWYLPAPEVSPGNPAHFRLVSKEQTPWDSIKLTFEATGPSHMSFYVRTHEGSTLSQWSLGNGTPVTSKGGDYFVFYSHGLQASAWRFWIEVQVLEERPEGMVTVALAAHYLSGEDKRSSQLDALREKFPDWTFPSAWVCTYSLFVF
uniref:Endoplasmic reticulum metallopeptidase 1 n=1 Tax=Suricata suricatta TaxID=37032 RepID=A0A673VFL4_SURSU